MFYPHYNVQGCDYKAMHIETIIGISYRIVFYPFCRLGPYALLKNLLLLPFKYQANN